MCIPPKSNNLTPLLFNTSANQLSLASALARRTLPSTHFRSTHTDIHTHMCNKSCYFILVVSYDMPTQKFRNLLHLVSPNTIHTWLSCNFIPRCSPTAIQRYFCVCVCALWHRKFHAIFSPNSQRKFDCRINGKMAFSSTFVVGCHCIGQPLFCCNVLDGARFKYHVIAAGIKVVGQLAAGVWKYYLVVGYLTKVNSILLHLTSLAGVSINLTRHLRPRLLATDFPIRSHTCLHCIAAIA